METGFIAFKFTSLFAFSLIAIYKCNSISDTNINVSNMAKNLKKARKKSAQQDGQKNATPATKPKVVSSTYNILFLNSKIHMGQVYFVLQYTKQYSFFHSEASYYSASRQDSKCI